MLDAETQARYRDLADWIAAVARRRRCPVIGITGAQGSGKSTAAAFIAEQLHGVHGLRAAVLSLDDFYLPRAARQALARQRHPLFATRGVPGSHDVALGVEILDRLQRLEPGQTLALPRFSKADDDRLPAAVWPRVTGPVDVILFEGWCVGLPAQLPVELGIPVNELEAHEDADGRWRWMVNEQLAGGYADWFARLDAQVFLAVPDFDCVLRWRWQQEQETARQAGGSGAGLQSRQQIERFISHYQRLSLHALQVMPARADALLGLDAEHRVIALQLRQPRIRGDRQ